MPVGEFPGLALNNNRRTIRAPINPMDKSTVVSIIPKRIVETKATITPGYFELASGSFDNPSILVVGPSRLRIQSSVTMLMVCSRVTCQTRCPAYSTSPVNMM